MRLTTPPRSDFSAHERVYYVHIYGTVIPSPNGWFNVMYPPYNAT